MRADEFALVDAAASVADAAPVDWGAIEARTDQRTRRLVRHLRLVESIATLHRSMPADDVDAADVRSTVREPAGERWGRLVLLERIGTGASCEVYRAWDSTLQQEVALKLLHDDGSGDDAHARLLDEARRLARVRHPHVVQVYGAEQHDGRVGLWMELVRGESLEHMVKTRGTLGAREAALVGLDTCAALAAVHGAGLLHRDVKAQNIMREARGRLVLMDFGTGEELSGTNRLVGTPLYLAPEIFRGQKASVRSDLYSLGVLLFYLTTGEFPVVAGSMEQLARAHVRRQRRPLRDLRPDLPEPFVGVVERALDADPARRYESAGGMEAALRDSLSPATVVAPVAAAPAVVPQRRLGLTFAVAVAVLAAAVMALLFWTRTSESTRGTVLSSIRTIAVMPMTVEGGANLPSHFASGLTDDLMASLGRVQALNVKSGLAVQALAGLPPKEIANRLGVDALLQTTVSTPTEGGTDMVRVRANLIAAGTENIVWTRAFERPRGQTSALQAEMMTLLASAVRLPLAPEERARVTQARTTSPAAEEAYLLGRFHLDQYGAGSADQGLKAFDRALKLDPQYAAAYAGAARAYVSLGANGTIGDAQARAEALRAVRRSLELDPDLADAHATLAHIYFRYDWDWPGADAEFRRSLELNPSSVYARTFYADYLAALGRFTEALDHASTAKRLDPQSGAAARRYALVLYYKHDFDGAERALQEAFAVEPNNAGGPLLEARVAEARGQYQVALDGLRRVADLSGGASVPLKIAILRLEALTGQRDTALAQLEELQRAGAAHEIKFTATYLAYAQLAFGRTDAALDLFEQGIGERDPALLWLGVDPRVDHLRSVPRFRQLLATIGLPFQP